jgi:seryl-tRNA synthetase
MRIPENFGSDEYIKELDSLLDELNTLRSQMGRMERKERFTISRAMDSIKSIKRRAERYGTRKDMLSEDYIRVLCATAMVESVLLENT